MSGQQQRMPVQIDPFRFAVKREHLLGKIPLKQLKRLTAELESSEGDVDVDVNFTIDDDGTTLLQGTINTEVQLICQRCLETMPHQLDIEFQLALVKTEAEMERLGDQYESCLIEDTPIMFSDLIEDELLLALPVIPKHLDDSCTQKVWSHQQTGDKHSKSVNPFNELADLKTDKQDEA